MQMNLVVLTVLLSLATVSAVPSQPEQVSNVVNSEVPYQLVPAPGAQVQGVQVVSNAPVGQPTGVVNQAPPASAVATATGEAVAQPAGVEQLRNQHPAVASYYNAPAGLVTVVGNEQANANKPVNTVRGYEQYGQPESAALPPNYKPFGSWGLYIGGNPADGYYTNYYKALSNSVEKQNFDFQHAGEAVKPVAAGEQRAALSPILRQASSSPYVGSDYYPFAYSPAELNSVNRVGVEPVHQVAPQPGTVLTTNQVGAPVSPVQAGAQVYGSPAAFETNYGVSPYADAFATKKVGAAYAQKEVTKEVPLAPAALKGYQSRVYVYPPVVTSPVLPLAAPAQYQTVQQAVSQQQQQLVAYPVPVGSQIVGSQPGVDGAFNPYGVHAFTRYAVKPTVVNQDPSYYVQTPTQQLPAYKQQAVYTTQATGASYYPYGSYYGYPLNQLHYSQGSLVPNAYGEPQHAPLQPNQVEAASEKSESEDKSQLIKQQKRA